MESQSRARRGAWLTATGSRRLAVRAVVAGALAGGLHRLGAGARARKKKGLGARCQKQDQCKGKLLCKNANSQNSCYDQTARRCCRKLGAQCNDSCECCGVDVICNGHICQTA